MNTIDIRIIGVEKRMEMVERNKSILNLPDDHIFIDKELRGNRYNASRAWLLPTEASHVLVLSDDVLLCDSFEKHINTIINTQPESIISLFPIQFQTRIIQPIPVHPYVETNLVSGCGIIVPTRFVRDIIETWSPDVKGDDTNIYMWANAHGVQTLTTIPATLQHIGDDSVNTPGLKIGRTKYYQQNVDHIDFADSFVNSWSNIVQWD